MIPIVGLFIWGTLNLALGAPAAAPQPQSPFQPQALVTGEIKSFHQIGDKIKGEFARLHPDGSVTKTLAFGDTKQGLQYKTYQMDPMGNVKTLDPATASAANKLNPAGTSGGQMTQTAPGAQGMTPGVNWFLQQPLVSPLSPALDPFNVDPFAAANPFATNPLVDPIASNPGLLGNPMWNLLNL